MGLLSELKKKDKVGLFKSTDNFVNYSTGLLPLDYANGFYLGVDQGDGTVKHVPVTGIIGGTFITVIGYSGSGKTTLADQIAYNIIKNYEDGIMCHFDPEHTALKPRILDITNASKDDPRVMLQNEMVSIEDVLAFINLVCKEKAELGDAAMYAVDTPVALELNNGKPFKAYVPTVIIIDSLAVFNSKNRNETELEGQMSTGREVKEVSQFYSKCLNSMAKYNITIIAVNHIKSKVDINPYQPSPKQIMLIGNTEFMPRGMAPVYLAQNVFRCNAIKSNLYTMEDNGFEGMKVTIQVAKSKTSFIGSTVDVCFNKAIGFDPIYTMFEFALSNGLIIGRNPYLSIKGMEEFKFNRKDFRNKFKDDKEFRTAFMCTIQPHLDAMLGSKDIDDEKTCYVGIKELMEGDNDNVIEEDEKVILPPRKAKK